MAETTFVYTTYIKTTPERLWQALTDPAFTRQYWAGVSFETDWKGGSEMVVQLQNGAVRIVDKQGKQLSGVRLNEDTYSIQIMDRQENLRSLLKRDATAPASGRRWISTWTRSSSTIRLQLRCLSVFGKPKTRSSCVSRAAPGRQSPRLARFRDDTWIR